MAGSGKKVKDEEKEHYYYSNTKKNEEKNPIPATNKQKWSIIWLSIQTIVGGYFLFWFLGFHGGLVDTTIMLWCNIEERVGAEKRRVK